MKELIKKRVEESIKVKESLYKDQLDNIERAASVMIRSLAKGGKILIFGNGGSAADSQHIAAELVGRFKKERRPIKAIALTTNSSIISAVANDYGYDMVFSRQVEALGEKGDVAVAISTSGNSKNVIEAVNIARRIGLVTIGFIGGDGGILKNNCDISIVVGSKDTARVQESHIMIGHIICELIENGL